jgi:hypothetical protein
MESIVLTAAYNGMVKPAVFIAQFTDMQDFTEWVKLGSKRDLECTLKAFEGAELYEYCQIINTHLKAMYIDIWEESRKANTNDNPIF